MLYPRPLHDQVVLIRKTLSGEHRFAGGILYLPDGTQAVSPEAIVAFKGSGRQLESGDIARLEVNEGDLVLLGKYSGTDIELPSEDPAVKIKYTLVREGEILSTLEEASPDITAYLRKLRGLDETPADGPTEAEVSATIAEIADRL